MLAGTQRCSFVVLLAIAVPSSSAMADGGAVTNQRVGLRATPEESAEPFRYLATGSDVAILERQGRWVYVKAGKTKGWITRTTIDETLDETEGAVDDGSVDGGSQTWGDKAETWGADGAEPAGAARDTADAEAFVGEKEEPGAESHAPSPPNPPPRLAVSGQLGYRSIGMDFTSNITQSAANYIIAAQAAAAIVGLRAAGRAGPLLVGGSVGYCGAYSAPGVRYQSSTGATDDIAMTSHEVDLDARVGIRAGSAMGGIDVLGRVGYMYGAYLVDDLNNLGRLPSESLSGLVLGASIRVGRITGGASLEIDAGMMIGGSRAQTVGLEDGMTTSTSATFARARVAHSLSASIDLVAEYDYSGRVTVWEGASARYTGVTRADRRDTMHTFAAGIARSF